MFPGITTRLSERHYTITDGVLDPKTDIAFIDNNTSLATIKPNFGGQSGVLFIVPNGGNLQLISGGNLAVANGSKDLANGVMYVAVYSKSYNLWFITDTQIPD